jgi:A/G-specific adenine glycosylase
MNPKERFFIKRLLYWFKKNRRHFPWRVEGVANPYNILVAELMLKKTRASNASEVYTRFIDFYPDANSISKSTGEDLERILQPLGLIRQRKKAFVEVFSIINNSYDGIIPSNKKSLQNLPYLGDYTVNAILCFGFNKKVPIVDVNVTRICERYFGMDVYGDPRVDKHIWKLLEKIIPARKFKEFNLALLDFGAMVCRSKNPKCVECVLTLKCMYNN